MSLRTIFSSPDADCNSFYLIEKEKVHRGPVSICFQTRVGFVNYDLHTKVERQIFQDFPCVRDLQCSQIWVFLCLCVTMLLILRNVFSVLFDWRYILDRKDEYCNALFILIKYFIYNNKFCTVRGASTLPFCLLYIISISLNRTAFIYKAVKQGTLEN